MRVEVAEHHNFLIRLQQWFDFFDDRCGFVVLLWPKVDDEKMDVVGFAMQITVMEPFAFWGVVNYLINKPLWKPMTRSYQTTTKLVCGKWKGDR